MNKVKPSGLVWINKECPILDIMDFNTSKAGAQHELLLNNPHLNLGIDTR
jgi:hypothetical protein